MRFARKLALLGTSVLLAATVIYDLWLVVPFIVYGLPKQALPVTSVSGSAVRFERIPWTVGDYLFIAALAGFNAILALAVWRLRKPRQHNGGGVSPSNAPSPARSR